MKHNHRTINNWSSDKKKNTDAFSQAPGNEKKQKKKPSPITQEPHTHRKEMLFSP